MNKEKKIIIMYASYSGNTEEVAILIQGYYVDLGFDVTMLEITENKLPVDLTEYDAIFFGTFTWGQGRTPDFVKDFIADIGWKPPNVAAFGTGETQFGEENYCTSVINIAKFYNSKVEPLLIEQSPRGSQTPKVLEWCEIAHDILFKTNLV